MFDHVILRTSAAW